MLDENRIKLMTRLASYEENEGKQAKRLSEYYRSDYVTLAMMKTAVYSTAAFGIAIGIYVLCNVEVFISEFYQTDFVDMAKRMASYYVAFLVTTVLIAYIVYSYRYTRAKRSLKVYMRALKRLLDMTGGR